MPKVYVGINGSYEIYDQSSIILRKIAANGSLTGKSELYHDVKNIPVRQDRWRIEQLIMGKNYLDNYKQI